MVKLFVFQESIEIPGGVDLPLKKVREEFAYATCNSGRDGPDGWRR